MATRKKTQTSSTKKGRTSGATQKAPAYAVKSRKYHTREYSVPHIIAIDNTITEPGITQVNLFNRADSLFEENFGNPKGITIQYVSNSPLVPYSYRRFLLNDSYFKVGLIEIRSKDKNQQGQVLSVLLNKGRGQFEGITLFPRCQPDIKGKEEELRKMGFPFVHFFLGDIWIQPNTSISFYLKNGASVIIHLYPTKVFDPTIQSGEVEMDLPEHYRKILEQEKIEKDKQDKLAAKWKKTKAPRAIKTKKPRK